MQFAENRKEARQAQVVMTGFVLGMLTMRQEEHEAAITAFIRSNGITRCPTACVLPTQGSIAPSDRAALTTYAAARGRLQQQKIAARERLFAGPNVPVGRGE